VESSYLLPKQAALKKSKNRLLRQGFVLPVAIQERDVQNLY